MPIPESQATPQEALAPRARWALASLSLAMLCLLYTSDAADE